MGFHVPLQSTDEFVQAMLDMRALCEPFADKTGVSIFPYSEYHVFYEQYAILVPNVRAAAPPLPPPRGARRVPRPVRAARARRRAARSPRRARPPSCARRCARPATGRRQSCSSPPSS